jgi:hypothetical protein
MLISHKPSFFLQNLKSVSRKGQKPFFAYFMIFVDKQTGRNYIIPARGLIVRACRPDYSSWLLLSSPVAIPEDQQGTGDEDRRIGADDDADQQGKSEVVDDTAAENEERQHHQQGGP